MGGISWAILACIGSFIYRQYTRDPSGFVHAWKGFITSISRLFDGGGLGRDGGEEQWTEDPENRGPDIAIRSTRLRSNSVVYRPPDVAEFARQKETNSEEQELLEDESSSERGKDRDNKEIEQPSGGEARDSDARKDSRKKKKKGKPKSKERKMKNAATGSRVGSDDDQSAMPDAAADSHEEDAPLGGSDGQGDGAKEKQKERSAGRNRRKSAPKPKGDKGSRTRKEEKRKSSKKPKKQVKSKEGDEPEDGDSEPEAEGDDSDDDSLYRHPTPASRTVRSQRKASRAKSPPRASAAQSTSADEASDEKPKTSRRPARKAPGRIRKAPDSGMEEDESEENANEDVPTENAAKSKRPSRSRNAGLRARPAEASRRVEDEAEKRLRGEGVTGSSRPKRSAEDDWKSGGSVASTAVKEDALGPRQRRARRYTNDKARSRSKDPEYSPRQWGNSPTDSCSTEGPRRRSVQDRKRPRRRNAGHRSDSYAEERNSEKMYSKYSSTGIESEEEDRAARQGKRKPHITSESTAEPDSPISDPEDPRGGYRESQRQTGRPDGNTSPGSAQRQADDWRQGSRIRTRSNERKNETATRVSNATKRDTPSSTATDEAVFKETAPRIRRPSGSKSAEGSVKALEETHRDTRKASSHDKDAMADVASEGSQHLVRPARGRDSPAERGPDRQNRDTEHRRERTDDRNDQTLRTRPDGPIRSRFTLQEADTETLSPSSPREDATKGAAKGAPDVLVPDERTSKKISRGKSLGQLEEGSRAGQIFDTARYSRQGEEPLSPRGDVNRRDVSETTRSRSSNQPNRGHATRLGGSDGQTPARGKQQKEHGDLGSSPPTRRGEPWESEKMNPAAKDKPEKKLQGRSDPGSSTDKAQVAQSFRQRDPAEPNHASSTTRTQTGKDAVKDAVKNPDNVDSQPAKNGVETYFAEDGGDPASSKSAPASPKTAANSKPSSETKDRPAEKPATSGRSKHERKQAEREATAGMDTAHDDIERVAPRADPPKGFWRGVQDGFLNARQHKTKTFLCLLLSIGYVIATGYGHEYGRSTPTGSSAPRRFDVRADSVGGAVESARERFKDVNVSPGTFQDHFLAISILWHLVLQLCIVFLVGDIIAAPRLVSSDTTAPRNDADAPRRLSRRRTSRDQISTTYHRMLRDPLSRAYHTLRRASKWTFIRLALIAFLALSMLLVARQLSSLAHIAADRETTRPWSEAPDVRWLHASLRANISRLGADGAKVLAASWGFWGMTGTALVYCDSALADRPAEAPVDEEMGVGETPEEAGKAP